MTAEVPSTNILINTFQKITGLSTKKTGTLIFVSEFSRTESGKKNTKSGYFSQIEFHTQLFLIFFPSKPQSKNIFLQKSIHHKKVSF